MTVGRKPRDRHSFNSKRVTKPVDLDGGIDNNERNRNAGENTD